MALQMCRRSIVFGGVFLLCFLAGRAIAKAQQPPSNARAADFAELDRYRDDNLRLLQAGMHIRVVFLGDSITEYWGERHGRWFTYPGWINRGIGGQTTSQLLLREQQDVLDLHPEAVVLEGGSNDMRLGFSPSEIRDNLATMGDLAEARHIRVFLTQMTPTCDCFRAVSGLRSPSKVNELNEALRTLARQKHWTLLLTHDALADTQGKMRAEFTVDGVHPNDAGYAVLAPIVDRELRAYR